MSTERSDAAVPHLPGEMILGVRPVERRMSRLAAQGLDAVEIGARFRRSPAHVERILGLARLPGRELPSAPDAGGLRPVERRLLQAREDGVGSDVLGRRFLRSAEHIQRVQALADHKVAMRDADV